MSSDPFQLDRHRMIEDQLRPRGIRDERVLAVMAELPREQFVGSMCQHDSYCDRALPITEGQTISQPFMVASMTQLLRLDPAHTVLEIGTGSGYQTAVLARLAGHVDTIERIGVLQAEARGRLEGMGITNVTYQVGDGTKGWPEHAPYDRIIVTAGAPHTPPPLIDQLAENGRLVIPVGSRSEQTLTVLERREGRILEKPLYACRFVQLLGDEGWQPNTVRESDS